jgi:hypothetical protein
MTAMSDKTASDTLRQLIVYPPLEILGQIDDNRQTKIREAIKEFKTFRCANRSTGPERITSGSRHWHET